MLDESAHPSPPLLLVVVGGLSLRRASPLARGGVLVMTRGGAVSLGGLQGLISHQLGRGVEGLIIST